MGSILHTCRVTPLFEREDNFRQAYCLQALKQETGLPEVLPAWGNHHGVGFLVLENPHLHRFTKTVHSLALRFSKYSCYRPSLKSNSMSIFLYRNLYRTGPSISWQPSESDVGQWMSCLGLETVNTNYLASPNKINPRWVLCQSKKAIIFHFKRQWPLVETNSQVSHAHLRSNPTALLENLAPWKEIKFLCWQLMLISTNYFWVTWVKVNCHHGDS